MQGSLEALCRVGICELAGIRRGFGLENGEVKRGCSDNFWKDDSADRGLPKLKARVKDTFCRGFLGFRKFLVITSIHTQGHAKARDNSISTDGIVTQRSLLCMGLIQVSHFCLKIFNIGDFL